MNVELGKLADGGLCLMCDSPFPHQVRRVEYYTVQRLMMLVYDQPDQDDDLIHYELTDVADQSLRSSQTMLVVDHSPNRKLYGYDVPVVTIN